MFDFAVELVYSKSSLSIDEKYCPVVEKLFDDDINQDGNMQQQTNVTPIS